MTVIDVTTTDRDTRLVHFDDGHTVTLTDAELYALSAAERTELLEVIEQLAQLLVFYDSDLHHKEYAAFLRAQSVLERYQPVT